MNQLGSTRRALFVAVLTLLAIAVAVGQTGALKGRVADAESNQPLAGATVLLVGTKYGAAADVNGNYAIAGIPAGTYTVRVSYLGYIIQERQVTVAEEEITLNIGLTQSAIQQREVVVEVNRARNRETPAAFSDIGSEEINRKLHTQDAPLLIRNTPGVFAYSTDGVGNGESRLFVRGFDQNRVQVLINGIPTNDPESNSVYWSNWGAVSSAAASVQVQRGAGSSLYGAGSFGGSFNIITTEVAPKFGFEAHSYVGDPDLLVYGATVNSGLLADNLVAGSLTYDWKTGRGNRQGAYYEGANYYAGIALFPDVSSSLKIVLHGGPQLHTYSNTGPIAYFKKYGYDANPANYLPLGVLTQLVGTKTLQDSLNLNGDSRKLRDTKFLGLSHNFYHKPQLEFHYTRDIDEQNSVRGTFFYSVGRGGGSSVNGTSNLTSSSFGGDTTGYSTGLSAIQNLNTLTGVINTDAGAARYVANQFLKNAYQRISYSLHQQWGFIASWDYKFSQDLKFTFGGEYRDWFADHPGYFTNLFGKSFLTIQRYAYKVGGVVRSSQFTRRTYQGDMKEFGGTDRLDVSYLNPFMGYDMSTENGTYNAQYRNYEGNTVQGTLFLQTSYKYEDFIFTGSIQYVKYRYHIKENMPSESAIADSVAAPASGVEGADGQGNFYMASYANNAATTPNAWYRFKLVDDIRAKDFWQPKFGVNYNVTPELNVFANYSHVQRFVDLSVYYNSGNVNKAADDEKSNQYELGSGFKNDVIDAKLNGYYMTWENKTASIQDLSRAGQPGFDRNGFRYELVGSSRNMGLEFEGNLKLDSFLPIKGLTVNLSLTLMDNKWTKVLDEVKTNPDGTRRAFDTGALNSAGAADTLFFDELENTVNASTPFTTITYGLTYANPTWFASINAITSMDYYAYDGGTYIPVDGTFSTAAVPRFTAKYGNKLPNSTVVDLQAGIYLKFDPMKVRVTAQIMNVFDTRYLVSANRSGVLPGMLRSYRLNVGVGL